MHLNGRLVSNFSMRLRNLKALTRWLPQPVRMGLRQIYFAGNKYECPLCGAHVRCYLSHGGGSAIVEQRRVVGGMFRANDRCPVCHAVDRTRLIKLYLDKIAQIQNGCHAVLHVAPEVGLYKYINALRDLRYVCTDLDGFRYRHIKHFISANLEDLPFPESSFDIVICSHVMEHVPNDRRAMRELFRVLKPAGHAIVHVPLAFDGGPTDEDPHIVDPDVRLSRFGQHDHLRIYGRKDFVDRLTDAGFSVEEFGPFDQYGSESVALRLNPDEVLFVGRKAV